MPTYALLLAHDEYPTSTTAWPAQQDAPHSPCDGWAEWFSHTPLLFSLLLVLYRQHGHWQIKPAIFAALLLWCLLDSSISAYFDLWLHAYLNSAAALAIALPLWALRPLRACR